MLKLLTIQDLQQVPKDCLVACIAALCVPHTASDARFSSPWRGGSRVAGPGGGAQVSRRDSNPPHTRACARTRHPPTRMRPLLTTHTRAQQVHPPLPPPRRRPDTSRRHGSRRRRFSVATVIAIAATPAAAAPATATPAAATVPAVAAVLAAVTVPAAAIVPAAATAVPAAATAVPAAAIVPATVFAVATVFAAATVQVLLNISTVHALVGEARKVTLYCCMLHCARRGKLFDMSKYYHWWAALALRQAEPRLETRKLKSGL